MVSIASGFSIGPVSVPNRLVLAPLAGVTDVLFRAICKKEGAGLVFTEMISDQGLIHSNPESRGIMEITPEERPVAIQVFGSKPEFMAQAAAIVAEEQPDLIDINMGCPVPKVVKNREGCALMLDPDRAVSIIEAVRAASNLPVTVKIRKGWDAGNVNAVEFAERCEQAGVAAITVHGRTRTQFYSGEADWDIIRQVKARVSVPVIGNGDVWQPEDAMRMLETTGCDAVMIGRGSLGNPWIFSRALLAAAGEPAPEPAVHDRVSMAIRHLGLTIAMRGEKSGVPYMRKHIAWYIKGIPGAARVRERVNTVHSSEEVVEILKQFEESIGKV